ncbi:hypothetical protein ET495_06840 [Xylanimonas allomyrinae]|uniref:Uncharacterized protein n=1 Tax=Xylanimonas allomyrinae TaxID=2509459 RepID=A0A4P6EK85_9MICO|nr:hypothetical protein ET495_06840 [Xylanimonas allomyrinae]
MGVLVLDRGGRPERAVGVGVGLSAVFEGLERGWAPEAGEGDEGQGGGRGGEAVCSSGSQDGAGG